MIDLKKWMSDHAASADELAAHLGVSTKTLYNWRSEGIPPSRRDWVEDMLEKFERSRVAIPQRMVLSLNDEEFDLINSASLKSGKLLKEWILESLKEAAAEEMNRNGKYRSSHGAILLSEKDPED